MISSEKQLSPDQHSLPPDLDLQEINKRFDSVVALDHASITVRKGSIHALLGENGAGKTTLMRIAFGLITPDSGSIRVRGKPVRFGSPAGAIAAGIGMVHQQFSLVPEMTVAENVALGGTGRYDRHLVAHRIEAISKKLGVQLDPLAKVSTLAGSERQKLEIIRTLAHDAKTLILDEPTAVLTPKDIGNLFAQLRAFANEGGSVILITHKLQDAIRHADEVTVLRHGRQILNSAVTDVDHEILAAAMLGATLTLRTHLLPRPPRSSKTVLQLTDVTLRDERGIEQLSRVSLEIVSGEIVGVAALDGAAREMLRLIAGRREPTSGTILRPPVTGFVPENRQDEAIIPEFSLTENLALALAGSLSGRMVWPRTERQAETIINEYGVQAQSPGASASSLSGGNQQKFVLGRELRDDPRLLVLENPTQGLDVQAADAIHEKLKSARDGGAAVVIYSSDLDELAALSDRVLVVSQGHISFTEASKSSIGTALLATTQRNA